MNRITLAVLAGLASLGIVSSSSAADLIIEEAPVVGVVDVSGDWEGPYVGIFGGWASGTADHTNAGGDLALIGGADNDLSGGLVGLKAGANFYLTDGVVAGIVGDVAWSNVSGEDTFTVDDWYSSNTVNWQGSVRGILGFDGGAFLPYLTAGVAFAHATHDSEFADSVGGDALADATHVGWTAGVGVEFAVTQDVSVNLEYRYSDFGSATDDHNTPPFFDPPEFDLTTHAVTAGINFRF